MKTCYVCFKIDWSKKYPQRIDKIAFRNRIDAEEWIAAKGGPTALMDYGYEKLEMVG